jgi:hypothetical protein
MTSQEERQQGPEEQERREDDEDRQDGEQEQQGDQGDGEGAGPAEDLEKDPAYTPQGPEGKYKGG